MFFIIGYKYYLSEKFKYYTSYVYLNLITVIQVKGHLSLFLESLVNKPPLDLSSLKRPDSRTLPDSKTKILSQFSMVLILWAMIMVVRPSMALFKAY